MLKSWWHRARTPPVYFYRDRDGREVDLVFDIDGQLWPVETKHAATVRREWTHPFTALACLGKPLGHGVVVCLTAERVPVSRNITALPVGARCFTIFEDLRMARRFDRSALGGATSTREEESLGCGPGPR